LHPELFGNKAVAIHPAPATRAPDALPQELRDRAGKTLSGLAAGAASDKDVRALLDQARRSFGEQAAAGRTRLNDEWGAVQKRLEGMPPMPPARGRKR
jgi:hypothetical protein